MENFKQYRRKEVAELREVTQFDIDQFAEKGILVAHSTKDNEIPVSITHEDQTNGSPKIGDMIARNPNNHNDQWLVAKEYFKDNFEPA